MVLFLPQRLKAQFLLLLSARFKACPYHTATATGREPAPSAVEQVAARNATFLISWVREAFLVGFQRTNRRRPVRVIAATWRI